jgi:carbon monoxide dehydrogenase subunit G
VNLKGTYKLKGRLEQVWAALNDPEVLRQCTPGCRQMIAAGDDCFDVVIEIGIAAIKGRYTGQIKISDRVPNQRYTLAVSGTGTAGFMHATGLINLSGQDNETVIEYTGEANVGGLVAGVGQRVMEGIAKLLVGQFFKSFEATFNKSGERVNSFGASGLRD